MLKITKNFKTGEIFLNPDSFTFGRSAYLCYNQSCIEQAFKKNRLAKVLKTSIGEDLKGIINEQFKGKWISKRA